MFLIARYLLGKPSIYWPLAGRTYELMPFQGASCRIIYFQQAWHEECFRSVRLKGGLYHGDSSHRLAGRCDFGGEPLSAGFKAPRNHLAVVLPFPFMRPDHRTAHYEPEIWSYWKNRSLHARGLEPENLRSGVAGDEEHFELGIAGCQGFCQLIAIFTG
jgi:hypothetical protein